MATAVLIASRSICERLQVGCVIVTGGERKNRLVAAGYNGFLPATPHVSRVRDGHEQATVHAEQNAVADAARRIRHRILLGMHRRLLVAIPHPRNMRRRREKPVIAGCHQAVFPLAARHNHTAHLQALADRARRDQHRRRHKVLIPGRAMGEFPGRFRNQIHRQDRTGRNRGNVRQDWERRKAHECGRNSGQDRWRGQPSFRKYRNPRSRRFPTHAAHP